MFYIIQDKEIKFIIEQGDATQYENIEEYTVLEGEPNCYYDGIKLIPIPPQPGENYRWVDNKWIEVVVTDFTPTIADFEGFLESLRGTDVWNKIKYVCTKSLTLNMAGTILIAALTATKSIVGTEEALRDLRMAMKLSTQVSDFTNAEIDTINTAFAEHNIPITLIYSTPIITP